MAINTELPVDTIVLDSETIPVAETGTKDYEQLNNIPVITTTNTAGLSPVENEPVKGHIQFHKISKTGSLSDAIEDANHKTVSDSEKSTWNNKSDFDGEFASLKNVPTATDTTAGLICVATDADVQSGTTENKAVTPHQLKTALDDLRSSSGSGLVCKTVSVEEMLSLTASHFDKIQCVKFVPKQNILLKGDTISIGANGVETANDVGSLLVPGTELIFRPAGHDLPTSDADAWRFVCVDPGMWVYTYAMQVYNGMITVEETYAILSHGKFEYSRMWNIPILTDNDATFTIYYFE